MNATGIVWQALRARGYSRRNNTSPTTLQKHVRKPSIAPMGW